MLKINPEWMYILGVINLLFLYLKQNPENNIKLLIVSEKYREINHKIKLKSPITGLKYSEMKSVNLMIV